MDKLLVRWLSLLTTDFVPLNANLLALTGFLTQNAKEVEDLFRRMVFNYLTDNKDDHCKNFSFTVSDNENG